MSIILLLCTEYPVKQRLFKHSGFIMIRLFLVILMVMDTKSDYIFTMTLNGLMPNLECWLSVSKFVR